MNKLTNEQVETAVNWWANVVVNPKFDNGDDSFTGKMTEMLMTRNVKKLSDHQVAVFRNFLTHVVSGFDKDDLLTCDYHPCEQLSLACTASLVPETNIPIKTSMYFRRGGVQVVYGYAAKIEELLLK